MLVAWLTLLAQEAPKGQEGPPWAQYVLPVGMVVIGYLVLFRPMQKQERERKALLSTLKKNDRVVTSAGIIGTVVSIKEKEEQVALKIDDGSNVRLWVLRSSIARILTGEEAKDKDGKET